MIHVKDSLLDALAREPKVCPHLHVPMQSSDDSVHSHGHHTQRRYVSEWARGPDGGTRGQRHRRRDRRVPRPRTRRRSSAPWRRSTPPASAASTRSPIPRVRGPSSPTSVTACRRKKRRSRVAGDADPARATSRPAKLGTRERVLVDKAADTQCSGYTATTRAIRPPARPRAGAVVDVVCEELPRRRIARRFGPARLGCLIGTESVSAALALGTCVRLLYTTPHGTRIGGEPPRAVPCRAERVPGRAGPRRAAVPSPNPRGLRRPKAILMVWRSSNRSAPT